MSVLAYIGIGSNLEAPQRQVILATAALSNLPEVQLTRRSSWYRTKPMGPPGQDAYVNGVAEIRTTLSPRLLLVALQKIESDQGRVRHERWGSRIIDLDLLLYGDLQLDTPELTVPHPEMANRDFVLYPLAELDPSLHIPGSASLAQLLAACPVRGIVRLPEEESCEPKQ